MVSLVLALVTHQDGDPLARNAAFMKGIKGLTAEYRIRLAGNPNVGTAKLVARTPDMQRYTMRWSGESMEYVHSKAGALIVRHDLKQYDESRVFPQNIQPFGPIVGIADIAYPAFHQADS